MYVLYLYDQSKLIKAEWEAREEPLEGNSITGQSTNLQYEAWPIYVMWLIPNNEREMKIKRIQI